MTVRKGCWFGAIACFVLSTSAQAQVQVTLGIIARVDPTPQPISARVIDGNDTAGNRLALSVLEVVIAELERTISFKFASSAAVQNARNTEDELPDFKDLRAQRISELLEARIEPRGDGRQQLRFSLWDVYAGTRMSSDVVPVDAVDWRHTAYLIANAVYQRTMGSPARFDEPVVFAASAGKADPRLVAMDWDGWNPRYLTEKQEAAFPPRIGPDGTVLCLVRAGHTPHLYRFELDGRRVALPGDFSRVTGTPSPSPDGQAIVFSRSDGEHANLYRLDLRTREETRLSSGPWMETDPSYAPDGQGIAFVSNRGGTPQLYVMNPDGTAPHRVSFGAGRYLSVAWSSAGHLLALVKAVPDAVSSDKPAHEHYLVEVMQVDGSGEKPLDAFPAAPELAWTSDGRALFVAGGMASSGDRKAAMTMFYFVDRAYRYPHRKDFQVDLPGAAPR